MKKLALIVSVSIVSLLALAGITGLLALHPWVQLQLLRQLFDVMARRSDTRIEITEVQGGLSGEVWFSGLRVSEPDGETMVAVDRGRGFIDLRALFDRTVDISSLTLVGVQLHLRNGEALNIVEFGESLAARSAVEREALGIEPWSVRFHNTALSDARVSYSRQQDDAQPLRFDGVRLQASELEIDRGQVLLDVRRLSLQDFNGLSLEHGELLLVIDQRSVSVDHLWLAGADSTVRAAFSLSAAPDEDAGNELDTDRSQLIGGNSLVSATVYDTRVAATDLEQVLPLLPVQLRDALRGSDFAVSASVFGTLDNLQVPLIDISLDERNRFSAHGELQGLVTSEQLSYSVNIDQLRFDRERLQSLGVDTRQLPVLLPDWMSISGTLSGSRYWLEADLAGDSSAGHAGLRGEIHPLQEWPDTPLGAPLAHALRARVTFGEELDASFEADVNQRADAAQYRGSVEVAHADLERLGLAGGPQQLRGDALFDVSILQPSEFSAEVTLENLLLREEERQHRLNRLSLTAYSAAEGSGHDSRLNVDSEVLQVRFSSDLRFDALSDNLQQHLQRYFGFPDSEIPERPDGSIDLTVDLNEPLSLLVPLIPELRALSTAHARMSYDGSSGSLAAELDVQQIAVANLSARDLRLEVSSGPRVLLYEISASRFDAAQRRFHHPRLRGDARGNTLSAYLVLDDEQGAELLRGGARARVEDRSLVVRFEPQQLMVRSHRWQINDDHQIHIAEDAVRFENLHLEKEQSAISIHSRTLDEQPFPPIDIEFTDFDIATIIPLLDQDADGYSGALDGAVTLFFAERQLSMIAADLRGGDLVLASRDVGNVVLEAEYEDGLSRFRVEVSKDDNLAEAGGWFDPGKQRGEVDVILTRLDIEYLSGYIPDELSDTSGYISGEISAGGTIGAPDINGTIAFRDAGFVVTQLGTSFSVGDETIEIAGNEVRFAGFSVRDQAGNRVTVDGTISLAPDPRDIILDLGIRTGRFQILDTAVRDNPRFWGRLVIDSDLRLSGALAEPRALGDIGLQQGSSVTLVLPDPGALVGEAEGVVRFRDRDAVDGLPQEIEPAQTVFTGVDVTTNLRVDRATLVELIVDQRSGDRLRMRGGGELSLGIDPTGTLSLAGRYEISEGSYVLSFYNIARREFSIASGSSVVWTGDPLEATLDVRASYTVRTSVAPLLAPAAAVEEPEPGAAMTGDLLFQVVLSMQGSLMQPEIEFSIDMPPRERSAMGGAPYAAVQQINQNESRRNTQAFSLIVLNQFVADDLGRIDEAAVVGAGARSSASQLLSNQLNALSRRVIPGVDLTFEIESYEEFTEHGPEGRTEVGLQLSQRLLDERLIVRFGGQVDIEGERSRETGFSEIAGDLSVEYLLTADGRYRIRGFREQQYQGPLEGALTTTGVSLLFRHEFDHLPWFRSRGEQAVIRKREEAEQE